MVRILKHVFQVYIVFSHLFSTAAGASSLAEEGSITFLYSSAHTTATIAVCSYSCQLTR